jgi:hypothetical protein
MISGYAEVCRILNIRYHMHQGRWLSPFQLGSPATVAAPLLGPVCWSSVTTSLPIRPTKVAAAQAAGCTRIVA